MNWVRCGALCHYKTNPRNSFEEFKGFYNAAVDDAAGKTKPKTKVTKGRTFSSLDAETEVPTMYPFVSQCYTTVLHAQSTRTGQTPASTHMCAHRGSARSKPKIAREKKRRSQSAFERRIPK